MKAMEVSMLLKKELFWMNNTTMIELGFSFIHIWEANYPLADSTLMDMHTSAEQTQPHPIIALYSFLFSV